MAKDGQRPRKPRSPAADRPRPPSMADVAAMAGVSAQTVSRVVNATARVDDATRDRVVRAVRMLGYRPNTAARALATGKFRTIGVISFDLTAHGNARTLESIVSAVQSTEYSVNVVVPQAQTQEAVLDAFRRLSGHAVDGVIVNEAQILTGSLVLPSGLPVVVVDGGDDHRYPGVHTDHAAGAEIAVTHLLGLGHTTVWHLAGPQDSHPARRRAEAWQRALRAAGAPIPPAVHGDWSAESGYRAGRELAGLPEVTAVFAANDQMALGMVRALRDVGRSVPQDVSVVGFDNIAESAYFLPPLTTVDQDLSQVGAACVDRLLSQIEGAASTDSSLVSVMPTLVERDSAAPPRV
ncbi:LacI family DNA-binding transcriptional regulator [Streptomyces sp. NBC_00190]|uniref:LacI family DNA-binding transcriptional regulator n=1 Tax=unclassified Streptomyces TaxID=2593676 RepID=UPI002E2DDDB4|nr:LacI family DNA-binding transcriptional regulator [Streptomyces sp. NBC_00190]WSZ44404.1 LacI family DNA-binding transcriptional regulator [Streptomyces sp. NBC_00868]